MSAPAPSPAVIAELTPTGALRAAVNMSNFLLVTSKAANGDPAGVSPDVAAEIARLTQLTAQTVSLITKRLEADGLLVRGDPVRGKVGQPSVPLSLYQRTRGSSPPGGQEMVRRDQPDRATAGRPSTPRSSSPCSARARPQGFMLAGEPEKPCVTTMPMSSPSADHGSAPGINVMSHLPGTPVDEVPIGAKVRLVWETTKATGQKIPEWQIEA